MNTASTPLGFAGTPAAMPQRNFYLGLWRRVPRELGFLLLGLPIATVGYGVTIGLFTAGVGTLVTFFIGLILLIAALYVSRGFGTLELIRLEWAGQAAIERPEWQDARAKTGFFGWLRAVLGNGHYWLYLLHTMIVDFVVSTVTWTITIVWTSGGLGGISYWFWERFLPPQADNDGWNLSQSVLWLFGGRASAADYTTWDPFFYFVAGVVMLATLPFLTPALTMLHQAIARGMLGSFTSDALQRRVADLSESRGAAISAEGHSLRRLERDIHDGPQQRLVRLQMDLAAADRQLDADPEKARGLIGEAMQQSRDALDELRALSRGFAPPILMDRGLIAALESAAVRCPLPARIISELPDGTGHSGDTGQSDGTGHSGGIELPQEIERNAYFVASEALTNAAKHSSASSVEVTVGLRRLPESDETWLDVTITDDGRGGAVQLEGHGLAGLKERMRGLGGTLEVWSPEGGPTVVSAHLPVTTSVPSSIGRPSTPMPNNCSRSWSHWPPTWLSSTCECRPPSATRVCVPRSAPANSCRRWASCCSRSMSRSRTRRSCCPPAVAASVICLRIGWPRSPSWPTRSNGSRPAAPCSTPRWLRS